MTIDTLKEEHNANGKTIKFWINKVNKVLSVWVEPIAGEVLGGQNRIVEVDETKIGQWIFEMYDMELGQSTMVKKRSV